jgi:thiamine kinase-like enzyme
MSQVRGKGIGFGWESRTEESKAKILHQLKGYIQQLRNLIPPGEGYVGALSGCKAFDLRVPALKEGFESFASVAEFHLAIREGIDRVAEGTDERKDDFNRLVFLQNACTNITRFSHGDLSAHNILVNGNDITGIIDWETSGWYPEYWEYARRKCDCHPFEEFWSNETDRFLERFPDAVEMEDLRIEIFGRF